MIDVKAIELAIGRQVDAGLVLDAENNARGIEPRLLARQGTKPFGNGIGTDGGRADARGRHGGRANTKDTLRPQMQARVSESHFSWQSTLFRRTFYFVITYLAEVEPAEEEFFSGELPGHDLRFVANLEEVGEDAEIVSSLVSTTIDGKYLAAHPHLACIAVRSGAVEHVDLRACEARGVVVCQVPDFGESTAAEHTFALILALSRRLREVMADSKVNEHFAREEARGVDLCGKTLGIVGLGRLGGA